MKILLEKYLPGKRNPPKSARDRIMGRFETWLDEVLADEKVLEGLDPALLLELEGETDTRVKGPAVGNSDTYATWGVMTALTQEVKLQGRAFRELRNDLAPLSELGTSVDNLAAAHRDAVSDARGVAERAHAVLTDHRKSLKIEADLQARNEVINALLDTRERLVIGLKSTEESRRKLEASVAENWFNKWRNGKKGDLKYAVDIISSLRKGYSLGLDRLDETIGKWGVVEIECEGKPFDPKVMNAVDMEERDDIPDGTVMKVFRTGYATDNEILRPAQVKVARAPEAASETALNE